MLGKMTNIFKEINIFILRLLLTTTLYSSTVYTTSNNYIGR